MRYWLNLFSLRTWDDFRESGSGVTGFRPTNWTRAKSVQVGDLFLCYLIGAKRWTGLLRVASDRYFDETERIFRDDIFPVRFQVEPLVMLSAEHGVPMEHLRGKLSFFPSDGTSKDWSGHVRSSPTKFAEEDGIVIRQVLESSSREPVSIPIDPKVIAGRKKSTGSRSPNARATRNVQEVMENPPANESALAVNDESSKVSEFRPLRFLRGWMKATQRSWRRKGSPSRRPTAVFRNCTAGIGSAGWSSIRNGRDRTFGTTGARRSSLNLFLWTSLFL